MSVLTTPEDKYIRAKARPDSGADEGINRIWFTSTDGKSDLVIWSRATEPEPGRIFRFEIYLGKEGITWTASGQMRNYVDEVDLKNQSVADLINKSPILQVFAGEEKVEEFLPRLRRAYEHYRRGLPNDLAQWIQDRLDNSHPGH